MVLLQKSTLGILHKRSAIYANVISLCGTRMGEKYNKVATRINLKLILLSADHLKPQWMLLNTYFKFV